MARPRKDAGIPSALPPKDGVVIRQETKPEKVAGREWKKENPDVSYDVLRVQTDGKLKVKVYRIESRKGITDRRLVAQFNNGKQVVNAMSLEALIKEGVDPAKLR